MKPFLPLLAVGMLAAAVPAPEAHFGHAMTADRQPLEWAQVVSYFEKLPGASDRIRVERIGATEMNRPMIMAVISSAENLKKLDRYRAIQGALADPRKTTPAAAEALIAEGKVVVAITCTIHANEPASTFSAVQFAYNLLTQDKARFRTILENTIFLLVPSLNPDGLDIVSSWARKTMGTPFEGTIPPELYQKYTGHDNNRDWYIFSQAETRNVVTRVHNAWHPQIVYDVHQMGPATARMFVPPWLDPIDPNVDAVIAQSANAIGMGVAMDLTAAGRKGVVTNAIYDFWTPARHYQSYHGGLRLLTESASVRLFSPVTMTAEQMKSQALGYHTGERSWNFLEPWTGGEWKLGDIVADQLISFESVLWQAAVRREDFLRNFYGVHQRAVGRVSPYAFVIPNGQRDPGATRKMLDTLRFGMVEVEVAKEKFTADGREYPAGSFVVRMQQPYSAFAKTLLEKQEYPDLRMYPGGPPKRPYDVTAQTLPLLMGVNTVTVQDRFQASLEPAQSLLPRPDRFPNAGALLASDMDSWKAVNSIWRTGAPVWRDMRTGDFYRSAVAGAVQKKRPRIGLYRSWISNMDEGWTRWMLEQFGFEYVRLTNADVKKGALRERLDVVVFPEARPASMHEGFRASAMPAEYTGGLGSEGVAALRAFGEAGGTLVFLNDSGEWAVEHLGLAARNVLAGLNSREFYCPGSLLHVRLAEGHPLGLGLPRELTVWNETSPAWEVAAGYSVANYLPEKVLASGWLLGEKYLAERSALAEIPVGKGRVILFGMRPQYRAQSYQTLKLLFNAFLY